MRYLVLLCVALVVANVLTLVLTDRALEKAGQERDAAIAASEIALARYAEATTQIRRDTVRITRWATRYDTLRDSVRVLVESGSADDSLYAETRSYRQLLHVMTEAADSSIAACRDLVTSTGRLVSACDSALAAERRVSAANLALYQSVKPSRFDRVKPWIFGAVGFWAGAKLRVP